MPTVKYDRAKLEQIARFYAAHGSREAGTLLGLSEYALRHALRRARALGIGIVLPAKRRGQHPHRAWTKPQEADLARRWRAGERASTIAEDLDRTRHAVLIRARTLGLPRRSQQRWTPAQDRIIEREVELLVDRLAERMGRTRGAIIARLVRVTMRRTRRTKLRSIADLGGMRDRARPDARKAS